MTYASFKPVNMKTDRWSNVNTDIKSPNEQSEKDLVFMSYNEEIEEVNQRHGYSWYLKISVMNQFNFSNLQEFFEEFSLQSQIEEKLKALIEEKNRVRKACSVVKDGIYEHHWYLSSRNMVFSEGIFENLFKLHQLRPFSFEIKRDENWSEICPIVTFLNKKLKKW